MAVVPPDPPLQPQGGHGCSHSCPGAILQVTLSSSSTEQPAISHPVLLNLQHGTNCVAQQCRQRWQQAGLVASMCCVGHLRPSEVDKLVWCVGLSGVCSSITASYRLPQFLLLRLLAADDDISGHPRGLLGRCRCTCFPSWQTPSSKTASWTTMETLCSTAARRHSNRREQRLSELADLAKLLLLQGTNARRRQAVCGHISTKFF
jgi:hypothetical protein